MAGPTKISGWEGSDSPFHAGERAVQERVGSRERVEQMGRRIVRRFMPDEHRELFEDLPFLLVGSEAPGGEVWASLLIGEPGFLRAPTAHRLEATVALLPGDPLAQRLKLGAPLGALGMELSTRRRNRVNGSVVALGEHGFAIEVEQSFGNCKQYIQSRAIDFAPVAEREPPEVETARLSADAARLLERTDTTFIATSSRDAERGGNEGVDISHRGGLPGFVRVEQDAEGSVLTLPDFSGNFLFNSFGNLEVNPRAGLLSLDFERGDVLSLTGVARVLWDAPASFAGAERLLELRVSRGLLWRGLLRSGGAVEVSPHLRDTGTWPRGE
jgi:uncharacterized protein